MNMLLYASDCHLNSKNLCDGLMKRYTQCHKENAFDSCNDSVGSCLFPIPAQKRFQDLLVLTRAKPLLAPAA